MTNNNDDDKPKATTATAINFISEVLEEAYCITNAAKDSGQPWLYLSMIKSLRRGKCYVDSEDASLLASKYSYTNENNIEMPANALATSTPQKVTDKSNFLGKGDDFNTGQNESTKSTSQLIKNLFEMGAIECSFNNETKEENVKCRGHHEDSEIMSKIDALDIQLNEATKTSTGSLNLSEFSFLTDIVDINERPNTDSQCNLYDMSSINGNETTSRDIKKENAFNYEDTYLTLNRDYEHFSEDDADGLFPILEDTRALTFQEVELLTAESDDNVYPSTPSAKERKLRAFTLPIGERGWPKSTLANRCRLQSSRLVASFRRWWGRKILKKRRGPRSIIRSLGVLSLDQSSFHPTFTCSKSSEV